MFICEVSVAFTSQANVEQTSANHGRESGGSEFTFFLLSPGSLTPVCGLGSIVKGFTSTICSIDSLYYIVSFYERRALNQTSRRLNFVEHIFLSDYDFHYSVYMLAIFGDSLYFKKDDVLSINEMNASNGNTVRSILVDKTYLGLIHMSISLQPLDM